MSIVIKCPFRFRCGKKWHCSVKRGSLKRKRVCLAECRNCNYKEAMNAAAAAVQN